MAQATAKDVARQAGVDPSTVSRVLNRPSSRHRYDEVTIQRIRAAARRLGYVPSRTAQALRTGKTLLLALLVSDISNPFFAELAAGIERRVRARGYRLLVCNTDESAAVQAGHLQELLSRGVDGVIVSPSGSEGLRPVMEAGVPLVSIDRRLPGLHVPHVGLDDVRAGQMLGEHLREVGYRQLGVVAPATKHDSSIRLRLQGLRQGLGQGGRVAWVADILHLAPLREAAAAVRDKLQTSRPEAVVGLNLLSSLATLEAVGQLRLDVPGQIGLAGIDDFAAAPFLQSPLTVVAQPIDAIAEETVAILLGPPKQGGNGPIHFLEPVLMKRASLRSRVRMQEMRNVCVDSHDFGQ